MGLLHISFTRCLTFGCRSAACRAHAAAARGAAACGWPGPSSYWNHCASCQSVLPTANLCQSKGALRTRRIQPAARADVSPAGTGSGGSSSQSCQLLPAHTSPLAQKRNPGVLPLRGNHTRHCSSSVLFSSQNKTVLRWTGTASAKWVSQSNTCFYVPYKMISNFY